MKFTIDLGGAAHAVRRVWWRFTCGLLDRRERDVPRGTRCWDCGNRLSSAERYYYETQCERCLGIDLERRRVS